MAPDKDTTDHEPPDPGRENAAAPRDIDPETGQHRAYWVLTETERAKGFVRPLRYSYRHVGPPGPKFPLRDATEEELERYKQYGYVKYEDYQGTKGEVVGSWWTAERLAASNKGCGQVTSMGYEIAATYARQPSFYGSTFCYTCRDHLPVNEFVWIDQDGNQTPDRLGS